MSKAVNLVLAAIATVAMLVASAIAGAGTHAYAVNRTLPGIRITQPDLSPPKLRHGELVCPKGRALVAYPGNIKGCAAPNARAKRHHRH